MVEACHLQLGNTAVLQHDQPLHESQILLFDRKGSPDPVLGNLDQFSARQRQYTLPRLDHRADAVELGTNAIYEGSRRKECIARLESLIDNSLLRVPVAGMCFSGTDQLFGEPHTRLAF